MDSFLFAWKHLWDHGELRSHSKASKPTVVLVNGLTRNLKDPFKRERCCISPKDGNLADLGPWHRLWNTISAGPLRTAQWLFGTKKKPPPTRCYRNVYIGGNAGLNYYEEKNAGRDRVAERRDEAKAFVKWLLDEWGLPRWPKIPSASAGPLKLLFAHRGDAHNAHGQDRTLHDWKQLREAAKNFPGIELTFMDSFSRLSIMEQVNLTAQHHLYVGISGTNMFNALFLPPGAIAGMILPCCQAHSNFVSLLQNGNPGALVLFRSVSPRRRSAPCCHPYGNVSAAHDPGCYAPKLKTFSEILSSDAFMPVGCFRAMLSSMVKLALDRTARRAFAEATAGEMLFSEPLNQLDPVSGVSRVFDFRQCQGPTSSSASSSLAATAAPVGALDFD